MVNVEYGAVPQSQNDTEWANMLELRRAWEGLKGATAPLPDVWSSLSKQNIRFRRGWLCMVAAQPGVGKSMFALVYAAEANVPTLFFSADTEMVTVAKRVAAHVSGHEYKYVEQQLEYNPTVYDEALKRMDHIRWVQESSPTMDDIEAELLAYVELYGEYPTLIIIDNLSNVVAESDNEWQGLRRLMGEFHNLSHKTNSCVMVLHHVSESSEYLRKDRPYAPPPRRAIHGKVSALPEMILTLGYDVNDSILHVAAVKNRSGVASVNAENFVSLFVDYGSCQIGDDDSQGRAYRHSAVHRARVPNAYV